MEINSYKDLIEYKKRLAAKEDVGLRVLTYQWEEKQAEWKHMIKKVLIPLGVATTGIAINAALSKWTSNGANQDGGESHKVSSVGTTNSSYLNAQLAVDLFKIAAPLISAYFAKKKVE